jgi:protein-disulfide isomerase
MAEYKANENPNSSSNAIVIGLTVLLVLFVVLFVNEKMKSGEKSGTEVVSPLADDVVILKYKGGEIKAKDLKGNIAPRVKQISEEVIEMYKRGAENAVVEKILNEEAKKQGKADIQELLASIGTTKPVSDEEAEAFIKQNKLEKGFKDPSTGKMRKVTKEEIKGHLANRGKAEAQQAFIGKLMADAQIQIMLKETLTPVPALTSDEPVLGNPNAKVVIYAHSDFQCPYCARGKEVVRQIYEAYGDKVAIVFRHLPLEFHAEAKPAAIASICAQEQGKFWEYHDKLFDNYKSLSGDNYLKWAKELGLDETKFKSCLTSSDAQKKLEKSVRISQEVGANSTPTFFVGSKKEGKKLAGALPFPEFKKAIDEAAR